MRQWTGSSLFQVMTRCLLGASHYLNQCWLIINKTLWNKFQCNSNKNTKLSIHENASETIVCEMAAISPSIFQAEIHVAINHVRKICITTIHLNDCIREMYHYMSIAYIHTVNYFGEAYKELLLFSCKKSRNSYVGGPNMSNGSEPQRPQITNEDRTWF